MISMTLRGRVAIFNIVIVVLFIVLVIKYGQGLNLINFLLILGVVALSYILLERYERQ